MEYRYYFRSAYRFIGVRWPRRVCEYPVYRHGTQYPSDAWSRGMYNNYQCYVHGVASGGVTLYVHLVCGIQYIYVLGVVEVCLCNRRIHVHS